MKKIYQDHLEAAKHISNTSEKLTYLTSVLRSLLQLSVVVSFEVARDQTPSDEIDLVELTDRFCKPSDGLPLQILDTLTPILRGYVNKQFLYGWFESTKDIQEPVSKQLIKWIEFRNKRPGHGVLDTSVTNEWSTKTAEIIKNCLIVFSGIIPKIQDDKTLSLSKELNSLLISSPLLVDEHAIVILNIQASKGVWKLKGQLLSLMNAREFTENLPEDNIFSTKSLKLISEYKLSEIVSNNKTYSFFHNIPVRQTDTFEGRKNELNQIAEWVNDEDSRYCLVYGDGGYGKTTLVLEMLNQFLESQFDFNEPIPTIISHYTAKMTRWTEQGLVHFTGITPVMDECIRELIRYFHPVLSPDWYSVSGRQLIDKSVGVLKENGLSRNDILMVIDNTETLATSPQEVKELGSFLKSIGKLIGRIIITSRRREFIEATPIVIEGLSEAEGMRLMQRLAKEYNANPILQAGEARLRKVSNQLMNKPILLEALVKYIARSVLGIDPSIENVFKKSNEDLLEFLYEDAWLRMNQLQKEVFLVLIHISSPLDQTTISRACQEIGIQHTEFQAGLEETHFSVLTDYGRTYTIELVDLSRRFFLQQFGKLEQTDKDRIKLLASNVDKYAYEREKIEKEYKADRVAEAFRSEYAKAAKVYADKGDIKNAIEFYKLAIEDDPVNSALHDRFSWFLLNKTNNFLYAKEISQKAIELDKNNCNAIVGLALVYYRLGKIDEGDDQIELARLKGRSSSFCLLRKAIARYYKAREEIELESKIEFLEKAIELLDQAEKQNTRNGGYDEKNRKDIDRYESLARRYLTSLRSKRTKLNNQSSGQA